MACLVTKHLICCSAKVHRLKMQGTYFPFEQTGLLHFSLIVIVEYTISYSVPFLRKLRGLYDFKCFNFCLKPLSHEAFGLFLSITLYSCMLLWWQKE